MKPRRDDASKLARPWRIVVYGERIRDWSRYATQEAAQEAARLLRRRGLDARVVGPA